MNGNGGIIDLSVMDLAVSTLLVVAAGAVSLALGLRLERRLAWASLRTVVQLFLVGYVLKYVFGAQSAWLIVLVVLVMVGAASRAAVSRPNRTFHGATLNAFLTLSLSGIVTVVVVTAVIVDVRPWYTPQYMIPLLGMILGNSLTGISLCLDYLLETFSLRRDEVEAELALGATKWEAARDVLADGVRRGMIPIINSMLVVGIVSLPGMMTGQILAGNDPLVAVKYQIVVMFMIAAAAAVGSMIIALLVYRRLFNARHQLRYEQIRGPRVR